MKLILIMISDEDKDRTCKNLIEEGYNPTLVASTGEFLQFGKSILLLGVIEDKIDVVKEIINASTVSTQIKGGEKIKAEIYILNTSLDKINQGNNH